MEKEKKFKCHECKKSYKRKSDLNRHVRSKRQKFVCEVCNHVFNRKDNFVTHQRRFHKSTLDVSSSSASQIGGSNKSAKTDSQKPKNDSQDVENSDKNNREIVHALNGSVNSIKIYPRDVEKFDVLVFYSNVKNKVQDILVSSTPRRKGIKWYLMTRVEFSREKERLNHISEALPMLTCLQRSLVYTT